MQTALWDVRQMLTRDNKMAVFSGQSGPGGRGV